MLVIKHLSIILIFFHACSVRAQSIQDFRITVSFERSALKEVIAHLESITPFTFLAAADDVESARPISIHVKDQPLSELLKKILWEHQLDFTQSGKNIIIKKSKQSSASDQPIPIRKDFTVHGIVKSKSKGETIIGATITINELSKSTISNDYGFFSITLPEGIYSVQVSAVGMQTALFNLHVNGNIRQEILMEDDTASLAVVTVTASSSTATR